MPTLKAQFSSVNILYDSIRNSKEFLVPLNRPIFLQRLQLPVMHYANLASGSLILEKQLSVTIGRRR